MGELKYERLVCRNRPERGSMYIDGPYTENTEQEVYGIGFRGACQIPGSPANIAGGLMYEPVLIDPYPHRHPVDEYLIFTGPPEDPFRFDAHVEFTLGLDADAEKYDIDRPTTVRIPAGVWHCPLDFVRIDSPIFFEVALLQGNFGGTYIMPDGVRDLQYNGQIDCIMEPEKLCDACQRCLTLDWKK
ncbi:MAG: hypothetical protein LBN99_05535 [Oscillospiraceae bacterium]|jgi:hypothetical protein|nr:hypothetical protein [Oscillospiraceae bacterium]